MIAHGEDVQEDITGHPYLSISMPDLIRNNIERTLGTPVPPEAIAQLHALAFERSFDKNEYLAEAGTACKYQYFILEGACYSFYVNEKGDKNAIQFAVEGHWITDAASYFRGRPGVFDILTLEPTRALLLSRANFDTLCDAHPVFDRFFRMLLQNTLAALHYRIAKTNSEEAAHRYDEFSRLYPHFIRRIPQYLIASYLGITPQSLSRIRKSRARKKGA
jgi:CRP-like cAMP-binding protein